MRAATWPDIIRTAPGYRADPIDDPGATQNIGYADKLQHRYWHYKDLPFSPDGTPTQPPPEPNAETQIRALRTALASPTTSDDVKSYDMVWLEHLVGDVHQPLHATSRFTAALPAGDRGGNSIAICRATAAACSKQSAKALHSFSGRRTRDEQQAGIGRDQGTGHGEGAGRQGSRRRSGGVA